MKRILLPFLLILFFAGNVAALDKNIPKGDELYKKINKLGWIDGPKAISFGSADAKINVKSGSRYLAGQDAVQYMYWINGSVFSVDYLIITPKATYTYSFNKVGRSPNDFKDLNSDDLLKSMKDNMPASNAKRTQAGLETATNIKWFQKPAFDEKNHAAYYSYLVDWSNGDKTVQSSVMILGRSGHAKIRVLMDAKDYSRDNIILAIDTFGYNKEQEYTAWRQGDLVAAAGVATLVAASVGSKSVVTAAKFAWKFVILGIIAFGALIVGIFSRKKR